MHRTNYSIDSRKQPSRNGCGITDENLKKIFDKGESFGKINGTGLGLYQVKKTIQSAEGTIRCVQLTQGTRFEIQLPVLQTGVVFSSLPKADTIQIIDDDSFVKKMLETSYNVQDYAPTFQAGIALLAKNTESQVPVLVDYQLNDSKKGTDLIANQSRRQNIYLCTNDFDDPNLIKEARAIGRLWFWAPRCHRDWVLFVTILDNKLELRLVII